MIKITVDTKATRDYLKRLEGRLRDLRPQNRSAASRLLQLVQQNFLSRKTPWGTPWRRLAKSTLRERIRLGYGSDPLRASGWLYASLRPNSGRSSFGISALASYAEFHQFGNPDSLAWGRGRVNVPARPFLPVKESGPDMPVRWWDALLEPFDNLVNV